MTKRAPQKATKRITYAMTAAALAQDATQGSSPAPSPTLGDEANLLANSISAQADAIGVLIERLHPVLRAPDHPKEPGVDMAGTGVPLLDHVRVSGVRVCENTRAIEELIGRIAL